MRPPVQQSSGAIDALILYNMVYILELFCSFITQWAYDGGRLGWFRWSNQSYYVAPNKYNCRSNLLLS